MKFTEIKKMDARELQARLRELSLELGKLEFEREAKTLKKGHKIGMIKKDIARIQTAFHT